MPKPVSGAVRAGVLILLCAVLVAVQYSYDALRTRNALPDQVPSAAMVKAFDLGLHSAAASFLWLNTRTELPFLPRGPEHFLAGLDLVNRLDPRFGTPYAFTVLVLPSVPNYPGRVRAALEAGQRGLSVADPDWQIPFYMAALYQLELNDHENAVRYFDLAAATPGIPDIIKRFAVNYGIAPDSLQATKAAWTIIYETSPDPAVRDRAVAHIAHAEILQYMNAAVREFQKKNRRYPLDLRELVTSGTISAIPADPFGFNFRLYEGGVVGIAP